MVSARHPDRLGQAIRWSLAAHVVLLSVIILKGLVFPGEPVAIVPTLRVDMVGLPDLLKKDLVALPPPPAAEEAKEKPAEPKSEPKPEEVAKKEDLVFEPKKTKAESAKPKEEKKTKKAEKEKRDQKMNSAIARLRALEKIQEKGSDESIVVKGNKVSPGTSLSGEAKEAAQMGYYELVRDRVAENWELPPWLARQNFTAKIALTVDANGRITSLRFTKPSGNPQFDDAVKSALMASQPLPAPPTELRGNLASAGMTLGFPL